MKYLTQDIYEIIERFILAHTSGGSSPRLGSPICLGLWQGQHIMAGACVRASKEAETERVRKGGVP
jgi:hypothetical protein